jgi:hypothetical protein
MSDSMPTFLSDPAPAIYLILLAVTVVAGAIAARNQDRRSISRFGIVLALLLLVYAIDESFESPREEAVRRVEEMARAADAKNPDQFIEHLADTVEFRTSEKPVTVKRDELRNSPFWGMLRHNNVVVRVWDFSRDDVKQTDDGAIEIGFSAKGEVDGKMIPIYMKAAFKKQADGQWKLIRCASFEWASHDVPFVIHSVPK